MNTVIEAKRGVVIDKDGDKMPNVIMFSDDVGTYFVDGWDRRLERRSTFCFEEGMYFIPDGTVVYFVEDKR